MYEYYKDHQVAPVQNPVVEEDRKVQNIVDLLGIKNPLRVVEVTDQDLEAKLALFILFLLPKTFTEGDLVRVISTSTKNDIAQILIPKDVVLNVIQDPLQVIQKTLQHQAPQNRHPIKVTEKFQLPQIFLGTLKNNLGRNC